MSDSKTKRITKLTEQLTKARLERDEALAVLGDRLLDSATVRHFGERLRRAGCCCWRSAGFDCHDRKCASAALLREVLGPEETQRQVDEAHATSLIQSLLRRRSPFDYGEPMVPSGLDLEPYTNPYD